MRRSVDTPRSVSDARDAFLQVCFKSAGKAPSST
jgi:hypothetical protein